MDFLKLRLTGFKSFVESTELLIEPGMTGIVGPNGCGKSNLVEALRWVMGETSARKMRGGEMDDVIFGGTAQRPARNIAEVVLSLDNHSRTAPPAFNDQIEMEISRRIERGAGSDYRINGKGVRARDVQLLFADNNTGAHSPALVSQGRISALINARPQERRQVLEEAAGISGLHTRRHEAELRLKGAETNLTRLDDVLGAMETQLQSLKRQVRQAIRYRTVSEQIRQLEAAAFLQRWRAAQGQEAAARADFAAAEAQAQHFLIAATRLTTERTGAAAALPPLRQSEAAAAAALQRLALARDQLDAEERHVAEAQAAQKRRLSQIRDDLVREQALAADAGNAVQRLAEEQVALLREQAEEALREDAAGEALSAAQERAETQERQLSQLTGQVAADEARRATLERQAAELESRVRTLDRRLAEQQAQRDALDRSGPEPAALDAAELAVAAAEEGLEISRAQAEQAEAQREAAQTGLGRCRDALQTAETRRTRLQAEVQALSDVLAADGGGAFTPLLDALQVTPGAEAALAAALGDDLSAPLAPEAGRYWQSLPPCPTPPLPAGAVPLAGKVQAPAVLARALAAIGVVADAAAGQRLAASLLPGQVLVTAEGAAWRWDGLTLAAGTPTPAAVRLRQRNRLAELQQEHAAAQEAVDAVREHWEAARHQHEAAQQRERTARERSRDALAALNRTREQASRLAQAAAAQASRLAALDDALARLTADLREGQEAYARTCAVLADVPDPAAGRARLAEERAVLAETRAALTERRSVVERLQRDAHSRRQRLAAIAAEERGWRTRESGAGQRLRELEARLAAGEAENARLAERPLTLAGERQQLLERLAAVEQQRRQAAEALADGEARLLASERALKAAETELATAREARARAEGAVIAARQTAADLRERIEERLQTVPERLPGLAALESGENLPEPAVLESRLERLHRERDAMGPVNLRAELESADMEAQMTTLQTERADLLAAIGRLRQGIHSLNREARERLLAAFETVNRHFQTLFTRLFGGGKACLELTAVDDPLESGLEIFASPPGKRLQALSLLSGGEQALTAVSLLFAVFLTNPAPICVLDEVDAPLDEANVERFCALVEEISTVVGTRFLVITHHRLTMARVNRLFGVTMVEKGVSQLVSVDLQAAETLTSVA